MLPYAARLCLGVKVPFAHLDHVPKVVPHGARRDGFAARATDAVGRHLGHPIAIDAVKAAVATFDFHVLAGFHSCSLLALAGKLPYNPWLYNSNESGLTAQLPRSYHFTFHTRHPPPHHDTH